jgi:hypothetical protein
MRFPVDPREPFPWVRIALISALMLLFCGWSTCNAFFAFDSCQNSVPFPQISSLSPDAITDNSESVVLTVTGSGFVPQSRILWNGNPMRTTLMDSRHIQTTITQQTFLDFGGSPGSPVQISVASDGLAPVAGCPNGGNSGTLMLVIN